MKDRLPKQALPGTHSRIIAYQGANSSGNDHRKIFFRRYSDYLQDYEFKKYITEQNLSLMNITSTGKLTWFHACRTEDVPVDGGVCVKYKNEQIALFHFTRRNEWYATQNLCPHRMQMALSRGMIGSSNNEPKVACPFHKKTFSLVDGHCMNDDACDSIKTYPVRIDGHDVYIGVDEDDEASIVFA